MSTRQYTAEEKAQLTQLINEGVATLADIEALNEGLKDTVKSTAKDLDIKPALINRAIRIAHKREWDKHAEDFSEVEALLITTGRM